LCFDKRPSVGEPPERAKARCVPGLRVKPTPVRNGSEREAISVSISGQHFDLELDGCSAVS